MVGENYNPDDATEIGRNGWRQCSVAPSDLAEAVARDIPTLEQGGLLFVASHDCDVTNRSFSKEPNVEFLVARRVATKDGNYTLGKNSRLLHLDIATPAGPQPHELSADCKYRTTRRQLLGRRPSGDHRVFDTDRRLISRWLAKRYDRAAFPDAFNARVRPAQAELRRLLGRTGGPVTGLYLAIAEEELPSEELYELVIRATISVEDYADPALRAQAQECVDGLAGLLGGCDNIDVRDSALVAEDQLTLDDLSRVKRWDWDWMTEEGE